MISCIECFENVFGIVFYKSIIKFVLKYLIFFSDVLICGYLRILNIVKCVIMVFIVGFGGCVIEYLDYFKI